MRNETEATLSIVKLSWREGDVYFWSYKTPSEHMPYHCCSRKAIVKGGMLRDTFWHGVSDGRFWTAVQANERLDLEFKGNLDDFEPVSDYRVDCYDEADTLDMRHANSSLDGCFIKRGAKRSRERMLEKVRRKRERAESELSNAKWKIEQADAVEEKLLAGEDLDAIAIFL